MAGEPIFGRFNESHKNDIRDSRVGPTRKLAELVAQTPSVTTMVSASAIGYYGNDRGEEILTEESEPGDGFLADVCVGWEAATAPAAAAGKRVVNIRTVLFFPEILVFCRCSKPCSPPVWVVLLVMVSSGFLGSARMT